MIQIKMFTGTLEEIESAFNKWSASVMTGTQIQAMPLARVDDRWLKEVMYVLPARSNGIAIPTPALRDRAN